MKKRLIIALTFPIFLSMLSRPAAAQEDQGKGLDLVSADELSVKVFKGEQQNGRLVKVGAAIDTTDPDLVFRSGELLTVSYGTNFEGYIYFINVGPEGT